MNIIHSTSLDTETGWLVGTATFISLPAPIALIVFWIRDLLKGHIW